MRFNVISKYNPEMDQFLDVMFDNRRRCAFLAIRVTERNGEGLTDHLSHAEMMDIWVALGMRLNQLATFPSSVRAMDGYGFFILYKFKPGNFFPPKLDAIFFELLEYRLHLSQEPFVKFTCSVFLFQKL